MFSSCKRIYSVGKMNRNRHKFKVYNHRNKNKNYISIYTLFLEETT